MQTPNRSPIAALILAGGRGERLGGAIKSELVVGGVRLFDRVLERLGRCDPILVGHGRIAQDKLRLPATAVPVPDLEADYAGPLAGLAAAMAYFATLTRPPEWLVSVAVDTPFLPADYLDRCGAAIAGHDAAIASYGGQSYPTNAIWRVAAVLDLPARLAAGTAPHSLKRLASSVSAVDMPWPDDAGLNPFENVNTPEDLRAMEARASASRATSG